MYYGGSPTAFFTFAGEAAFASRVSDCGLDGCSYYITHSSGDRATTTNQIKSNDDGLANARVWRGG